MAYGLILRRSIELAWRHKWLWLLALFAGESSGGAPSFNGQGLSNLGNTGRSGPPSGMPGSVQAPDLTAVTDFIGAHLALLVAAAFALVVLWVVLFLFSCVCAAAITRAVDALDRDEAVGLGRAFGLGFQRFGAVFRLRLLLLLFGVGLLIVLGVAAGLGVVAAVVHAYLALGVMIVLGANLLVALFALGIVYPTFLRLALRMVAIDGTGAWAGLGNTVRLMRRRIGPVIVLWAIELAIGLGVGIALIVLSLSLLVPAGIAGYAAFTTGSPPAVTLAVTLVVLAVGLLLLIGAALASFFSSYWTLGFRQLQRT